MMKTSQKQIPEHDILQHVKIMRMLYGVELASDFYQKNFTDLTGLDIKDLHLLMEKYKVGLPMITARANVESPRDK